MSLDTYLRSCADRCSGCGFHVETQGCACPGQALKFDGMARASAAHPTERAKVEAAIRQLARTGRPFSANEARKIHGVSGGVVGAAFNALATAGEIRSAGDTRSTLGNTHGKAVALWIGVAA